MTPGQLDRSSELIAAHLGSALSHISQPVQRDALAVVDSLLADAPVLVLGIHQSVLPSCLSQIAEAGGNGTNLSSGVGGKVGVAKARLAVLGRISAILNLVGKEREEEERAIKAQRRRPLLDSSKRMPCGRGLMTLDQMQCHFSSILQSSNGHSLALPSQKVTFAREFSGKVVPLLLQAWQEIAPDGPVSSLGKGGKRKHVKHSAVTKEGAEIMIEVSKITRSLYHLLKEEEKVGLLPLDVLYVPLLELIMPLHI